MALTGRLGLLALLGAVVPLFLPGWGALFRAPLSGYTTFLMIRRGRAPPRATVSAFWIA